MEANSNFFETHWLDIVSVIAVFVIGIGLTLWLERRYKATKYVGFISYIPSVWTSLGILGTFISIYISLAMLDFTSLEDINQLVTRVAPAFSTSIVGIVGAVVCSIRNKLARSREEVREAQSYLQAVKSIDGKVSRMGDGVLEAAREMGREMVKAAGEEWRESLRKHIAAMAGAVEDEKKAFIQTSNDLIAALSKVSAAHNESMKKLLESYEKEALGVKVQCGMALQQMQSEHSEQLNRIAEENTERLSKIDENIKKSVEASFGDLSAQIKEVSDSIRNVSSDMEKVQEAIQKTAADVKSAGESFAQAKSDVDSVRKGVLSVMSESKKNLAENAERVDGILKTAEGVSAKMNDLVTKAVDSVAKASQVMERVESRVSRMSGASRSSGTKESSGSKPEVIKEQTVPSGRETKKSIFKGLFNKQS